MIELMALAFTNNTMAPNMMAIGKMIISMAEEKSNINSHNEVRDR
jgi:hypothetical protein